MMEDISLESKVLVIESLSKEIAMLIEGQHGEVATKALVVVLAMLIQQYEMEGCCPKEIKVNEVYNLLSSTLGIKSLEVYN